MQSSSRLPERIKSVMGRQTGGAKHMIRVKQFLKVVITAAVMSLGATAAMADGAKIFVIGGKADDPFWSKVKKGADDAGLVAKATGGSVIWLGPQNYDNLGPDAAKLLRTALSQNPSAVV